MDTETSKAREYIVKNQDLYSEYFRIPDAFKLTFKFQSLLPTNFNTYMMTFYETPMTEEKFENEGHHESIYGTIGDSLSVLFTLGSVPKRPSPTTSETGLLEDGTADPATRREKG